MPGLKLGVPPLDALLAPLPRECRVLYLNDPGVEAEPFLYHAAREQLKAGAPVVYVTLSRPPSRVRQGMKDFGFDPGGTLVFVDAYSALLGTTEDAPFECAPTAQALAASLEAAAKAHPGALLIIDAISTLIDTDPNVGAGIAKLGDAVRRFHVALALFTQWPYTSDVEAIQRIFDAHITLRTLEERVVFGQYFSVQRAPWVKNVSPRPHPYKLMRPGGIVLYVPKIVVTGPHGAGKTTFVHSVSDSARSSNYKGSTIGIDHGNVTLDGLRADLFGTPGQERFDPILKTVADQALGVILLVDATRPDTFARARDMLDLTWREGLPAIVGATHTDVPGAPTPAQVSKQLGAPQALPVVACNATSADDSRAVLRLLLARIMGGVA